MQIKVTTRANKKLKAVCKRWLLIALAKISSNVANETIKTNNGSKKATITLITTEDPSTSPNRL